MISSPARPPAAALGAALLLVLAGCAAPAVQPGGATVAWSWPEDPPSDRIGWENGYWHNESIAVDQSDGLNESEREAYVARTMARVEVVRDLEFREPVPVEVISRETYREQAGGWVSASAWDEQVWEAMLLVGEDATVNETFTQLYGGSVLGFYSASQDRIVIVSDGETPVVDRGTLAHELMHALQDQYFGFRGQETMDADLAAKGLTEGDPLYVEYRYQDRCEDGTWECVEAPARGGGGNRFNYGVYLTIYQPYADGAAFVDALYERGGWAAVNAAYEDRPVSTEQTIHPERYPDDRPERVRVPDRSGPAWAPMDHDPVGETIGEAGLFAMFWANGGIPRDALDNDDVRYSPYNYSHPVTEGWTGDRVVPYERSDGAHGYVFRTTWETEADAKAFRTGYRTMLQLRLGAHRVDDRTYVVEDGPFADAFRIVRDDRTVTIVNAPTVEDLEAVHRLG